MLHLDTLLASAVEPSWVACAQSFLDFWAWKLDQGCCWEGGSGPKLHACPSIILVEIQEFRGLVGLGRARTRVGTKESKRRWVSGRFLPIIPGAVSRSGHPFSSSLWGRCVCPGDTQYGWQVAAVTRTGGWAGLAA